MHCSPLRDGLGQGAAPWFWYCIRRGGIAVLLATSIGLQTTRVRAAEWHPARDIASDIFRGPQRQCNEPNSREHT